MSEGNFQKPPEAFRTISEASEEIGVAPHVMRFWEGKFANLKPLKRAGGRRFYRLQDILLMRGLKRLLQDEGVTIRGVQKLIKERGIQSVRDYSSGQSLGFNVDDVAEVDAIIETQEASIGQENETVAAPKPASPSNAAAPNGLALRRALARLEQVRLVLDGALQTGV